MIHIIVPSYNCERWIERTLLSVVDQRGEFNVLVVDDASTDAQAHIAGPICDEYGWEYRRNPQNMRAGYNIFTGIHSIERHPDDVIFLLDGDDFLPHEHVLQRIGDVYQDPDAWFVYGQYKPWPRNTGQVLSRPYPPGALETAQSGSLRREFEQHCNHPITFRSFLFDQLTGKEMKDHRGQWLRGGYDRVIFTPLLELAGPDHVRFVDEVLYSYNADNEISDTHVNLPEVQAAHAAVYRGKPRERLDKAEVARIRGAAEPRRTEEMSDALSIVIPYRRSDEDRERIFQWNRRRYSAMFPGVALVLGEMAADSEYFRRSEAINNGVRQVTTEFVLIADADVIAQREAVLEAMWMLMRNDCARVFPYENYGHLRRSATEERLKSDELELSFGAFDAEQWYPDSTSGLMVLRTATFWGAGGFDERLLGWGPEDRCFDEAIETLCGASLRVTGFDLYHLWHPVRLGHRADNPHYAAGMALWERYQAARGDHSRMLALVRSGHKEQAHGVY